MKTLSPFLPRPNRKRRLLFRCGPCLAGASLLVGNVQAADFSQPAPSKEKIDVMDMSIEELMKIQVTSVSKKREQLSDAASAIQVITQEDIRRSGVTTIPEALRLSP